MSFNVSAFAPLDEMRTRTFMLTLKGADGVDRVMPTEMTYYPNRIVIANNRPTVDRERSDDEAGETEADVQNGVARDLAHLVHRWDWVGPAYNPRTGEMIVAEGQEVPRDARIIQYFPLLLLNAAFNAIMDDAFPNRNGGKR